MASPLRREAGAVPPADGPAWLDRLGVEQPMLRRLGAYWERLRGDRRLPRREELEPWQIPELLPYLWIWRVEAEPRRFFLRLSGDRINRLLGYWRRGSELGEVAAGPALPMLRARYERAAFGPGIVRSRGYALLGRERGVRVRAERLMLPLGEGDAGAARDLLGITWYEELIHPGLAEVPTRSEETFLELDALPR